MIVYPPPGRRSNPAAGAAKKRLVQWRETNVEEGIVMVDEAMLSKLIKNEPIQKYYKLDPEPFATGMFASVRRCKSVETGQVYAAKFSSRIRYGEDSTREIHHEIALLSLTSPSPRIVKLHDVFQTPQEIIIVMEFAPGGDLQTIIDDNLVPFESDVVKYVQQVVEGLAYLHQRKIAHLDIKPQNLVMMGEFPDCDIKVCDFEISRVILEGTEIHEILGTPEYVAPEILHYEPITLAADMWSLGVTTYVLLTGFSPFGGETDQETFLNISRAQVDFPDELFEDISEEAKDFVRKLLKRKPSERMSAKESLKHPWLTKHRRAAKVTPLCKGIGGECGGEPRRVGCSSCPPSSQTLRKYLSKSREALFEKVISQQKQLEKQQTKDSLRKSTLLQQVNKTRRLCESQMSLVSKSREKMIAEQHALLTRSREKLYGLRSLSKSHEVLNLYKSLVNLHQDDEKALPGILKNLSEKVPDKSVSTSNNYSEKSRIVVPTDIRNGEKGHDENKENRNTRNSEKHDAEKNGIHEKRPSLQMTKALEPTNEPQSPVVSNSDTLSLTEFNSTTDSDVSEEDSCSTGRTTGEASTEEDEPRFTVKQLISAYNKHQEIVTKTSLEVTMSSDSLKEKIAPVFETGSLKFPTGPNALRLFIPDIKITSRKKRMPRKKTGIRPPPSLDIQEDGSDESTSGSKTDLSAINARLNEFCCTPVEPEIVSRLEENSTPAISRSNSSSSDKSKSSQSGVKSIKETTVSKVVERLKSPSITRPDRKSFSSPRPPPTNLSSDKTRRKSSPPTMKPFL